MSHGLTGRQTEFFERFEALLGEFADVVAPHVIHADEDALGPREIADRPLVPHVVLNEYIVLMGWHDLDDAEHYPLTRVCRPGMPIHHQVGLLRSDLDELEG